MTMRDFFAELDDTLKISSENNSNRKNNQNQSQSFGFKEQMVHGRGRDRGRTHDRRHHQYREKRGQETKTTATAPTTKITKRVDMRSFLQDVNALMEEKESSKTGGSKSIDVSSSISTAASDDRPSIYEMMRQQIRNRDGDDRPNDSREEGHPRISPSSDTTYGRESFQEYSDFLDKAMSHNRFARRHTSKPLDGDKLASVVEWLQSPVPVVDCIISLEDFRRSQSDQDGISSSKPTSTTSGADRAKLRSVIEEQREKFQDHFGWTKKQYDVAVATLKSICSLCARQATAAPLHVVWPKLNEAGWIMEVDLLHSLLYTSSSFSIPVKKWDMTSSGRSRNGGSLFDFLDDKTNEHRTKYSQFNENDDEVDDDDVVGQEEESPVDVAAEVATVHDILFDPTEQTTSISVRTLVSKGMLSGAERLLDARSVRIVERSDLFCLVPTAYCVH